LFLLDYHIEIYHLSKNKIMSTGMMNSKFVGFYNLLSRSLQLPIISFLLKHSSAGFYYFPFNFLNYKTIVLLFGP